MAYKLIWSPVARDDLHDIVVFIARDNPNRATNISLLVFGHNLHVYCSIKCPLNLSVKVRMDDNVLN